MMIKAILVNLFCVFLANGLLYGCPTCVGRITHDSPPFFSKEFYNSHIQEQSFDQKGNAEQQAMIDTKERGSHEKS